METSSVLLLNWWEKPQDNEPWHALCPVKLGFLNSPTGPEQQMSEDTPGKSLLKLVKMLKFSL